MQEGLRKTVSEAPSADVLIATTVHWASTTRLALALAEAGLRVAAVAPAQHALHRMSAVATARRCNPHSGFVASVATATRDLSPTKIIAGDDRAVRELHRLYRGSIAGGAQGRRIADTIRGSLGAPASFPVVAQKSRFAAFCVEEGLPIPDTVTVSCHQAFEAALARAALPQVLKLDGEWSGRGVRVVRSTRGARAAFDDLMGARSVWSALQGALETLSLVPLTDQLRGRAPAISMQRYVAGTLANRAVFCHAGTVLAGITVATVQLAHETGPTTVARIIDHPEIAELTRKIVERLNLSGFIGVDLVLEQGTGRPWLLELNPRPTQICHLAFDRATDMVGALVRQVRGTMPRSLPERAAIDGRLIALYPGEVWRDRSSAYLRAAYHDIPSHQPEFIAAYAQPVVDDPLSWVQLLARLRPLRALRRQLAAVGEPDDVDTVPIAPTPPETAGGG